MEDIYRVRVLPSEVRIEQISLEQEHTERKHLFPYYKNEPQDLPVIRIPIGLPVYRMANFRTITNQSTYIRKNNLKIDFFSKGQENESVQKIQHHFLYQYSQKGKGETIVPIKEVLETEKQHEPLLITFDGVVVNGNRRLSAMRELYSSGIEHFSHVDCMVLPINANVDELREIEIKLQMTRPTILPYEWLNEGYAIKELLHVGYSKSRIADLMRKKTGEIDIRIVAVDQAELYLSEWLEEPGDYSLLEESNEQMFMDIARNLKNKSGEDLEASRYIAFILANYSRSLGTRVYDYKASFGTKSIEVLEKLAKRHNVDLSQVPVDEELQIELDFEIDDEPGTEAITSYKPIIELLKDKSRSEELVEDITDIFDGIKAEENDQNKSQLALKKIKEALTRLMEVDLTRAENITYDPISQQLASIQQRVTQLQNELDTIIQTIRE
ncbi:hypothetical protein MHB48_10670 [Psychrobacillus sp. FSL H8-0483]|uniref:hypothetical protein n=1 Tax=Psychrobacillus sp. FSL H8-0483 TaxID=2921389 RepID=UPI00315B28DB